MEKKVLTGAIASAVAMAGMQPVGADYNGPTPKNPRMGLDNPLDDVSCDFDSDGFWAFWRDPNTVEHSDEDPTKYGGDVQFDAWFMAHCDFDGISQLEGVEGFEYSESGTVDVDLSRGEEPFHYECVAAPAEGEPEGVDCMAHLDWDDINEAAEDAAEHALGYLRYACDANLECSEAEFVCTETFETCDGDLWVNSPDGAADGGQCLVCEGLGAEFEAVDGDCYVCESEGLEVLDVVDGQCLTCDDEALGATVIDGECYACSEEAVGLNADGECMVCEGFGAQVDGENCYVCDGAAEFINADGECVDEYGDGVGRVITSFTPVEPVPVAPNEPVAKTLTEFTEAGFETVCDGGYDECTEWMLVGEGHDAQEAGEYSEIGECSWQGPEGYVSPPYSEGFVDGTCLHVDGNFFTAGTVHETAEFGVKEMNPGNKQPDGFPRTHGWGRQNWQKEYATCEYVENASD